MLIKPCPSTSMHKKGDRRMKKIDILYKEDLEAKWLDEPTKYEYVREGNCGLYGNERVEKVFPKDSYLLIGYYLLAKDVNKCKIYKAFYLKPWDRGHPSCTDESPYMKRKWDAPAEAVQIKSRGLK